MDIKNILNDGDRRAIQQQQQQQPHPAYEPQTYSHSPAPTQRLSSPVIRNPSLAYSQNVQTHPNLHQPHQIVYTGPVYQLPAALPPAVEVRHMGSTIHYRYAPYRYQEPPPVDYVYQEYAEMPRQPSQHYYDIEATQPRQSNNRQPYRSRGYLDDRGRYYSVREPYSEQDRERERYSTREEFLEREGYAYSDSYVRDSLVSRVVPVDGGYQYRPAHENPRQSINDNRYHEGDYRHSRYPSPPPRHQSDYDGYSYDRYRPGQSPYKRSRPTSPRNASPRRESYVENPPRPYQPTSTYPRKRRGYTTSQDSSEAEETAQYTVLKSEFRNDGPRRERTETSRTTNVKDDTSAKRKRVKTEPVVARKKEGGKTANKNRRERPKNTEIDSGQETVSEHSHDAAANLAARISAVTARRPPNSRSSPDEWSSDDNMTLNQYQQLPRRRDGNGLKQTNGKRMKKRRLMPPSSRTGKQSASDRRIIDEGGPLITRPSDDSRERNANFKQGKRRKEVFRAAPFTDDGSMEEEILDGAGSDGEKIPLNSTSSYQSDMGEKADVESEGSHREHVPLAERAKTHRPKTQPRSRPKKRYMPPCLDPKESYPPTSTEFLGVPPTAVGDLLQVWDFISSFSKTLRLTSFKLHHLQQAIVHEDRSALLDACILRLVQAIISDEALVKELRIPSAVTRGLGSKPGKNAVAVILQNLPNILDFESDEQDDHLLQTTVAKLDGSNNKLAFYKTLDPGGKLRILRELVDYATMADHLRACVTDSMDHAEEEKKKAREENAANRKKLESQIRELRAELLDYKSKNGLLENGSNADSDRGGTNSVKENGVKSESVSGASDREELLSRKEKLLAARKQKREQEERREKERGAEAIVARIEKVKANLKTLKNIRLRNRARDGDDRLTTSGSTVTLGELYEDPVRTYPLGTDRRKMCYWFFSGSGRIWVENTENGEWFTLNDMDRIHGLMKWLSPYRKEEQSLKRNIRQRLEIIDKEIVQEKRSIEQAELEEKEAEAAAGLAPRTTRAGKRRATQVKSKKKVVVSFLDYRNHER